MDDVEWKATKLIFGPKHLLYDKVTSPISHPPFLWLLEAIQGNFLSVDDEKTACQK